MASLAHFQLSHFPMRPEEVTFRVGVQPTQVRRIGEPFAPRVTLANRYNAWIVQSRLGEQADLEEHVADVLDQLRPGWSELVSLGAQYQADLNCVVKLQGSSIPSIHFEASEIRALGELNAEVDVDVYILDPSGAADESAGGPSQE